MRNSPCSCYILCKLFVLLLVLLSTGLSSAAPGDGQGCAACQFRRRKCTEKCELAAYFPANQTATLRSVLRKFRISTLLCILQQVPPDLRGDAMDSVKLEAAMRDEFPVGGCREAVEYYEAEYAKMLRAHLIVNSWLALYIRETDLEESNKDLEAMQDECLGVVSAEFPTSRDDLGECWRQELEGTQDDGHTIAASKFLPFGDDIGEYNNQESNTTQDNVQVIASSSFPQSRNDLETPYNQELKSTQGDGHDLAFLNLSSLGDKGQSGSGDTDRVLRRPRSDFLGNRNHGGSDLAGGMNRVVSQLIKLAKKHYMETHHDEDNINQGNGLVAGQCAPSDKERLRDQEETDIHRYCGVLKWMQALDSFNAEEMKAVVRFLEGLRNFSISCLGSNVVTATPRLGFCAESLQRAVGERDGFPLAHCYLVELPVTIDVSKFQRPSGDKKLTAEQLIGSQSGGVSQLESAAESCGEAFMSLNICEEEDISFHRRLPRRRTST